MYKLEAGIPFKLQRLGFIETPNNIAYMTWKPEEVIQIPYRFDSNENVRYRFCEI